MNITLAIRLKRLKSTIEYKSKQLLAYTICNLSRVIAEGRYIAQGELQEVAYYKPNILYK